MIVLCINTVYGKKIFVLVALLLSTSLIGCYAQAVDEGINTEGNAKQLQTVGTVKDQWTEGLVEGAYLFNPRLSNFSIDVEAKKDIVTLSGAVATETERALAERIALSIGSVNTVVNRITVTERTVSAEPEQDND